MTKTVEQEESRSNIEEPVSCEPIRILYSTKIMMQHEQQFNFLKILLFRFFLFFLVHFTLFVVSCFRRRVHEKITAAEEVLAASGKRIFGKMAGNRGMMWKLAKKKSGEDVNKTLTTEKIIM